MVTVPESLIRSSVIEIQTCKSNLFYRDLVIEVKDWQIGEWRARAFARETWLERNDGKISFALGAAAMYFIIKLAVQIK